MIPNGLTLAAERRNGSTVMTQLRAEGLWRTSRPFREGTAARIVLAQLGPGMIRGDRFASRGTVGSGAHLIVAGQMATRILPGRQPITTSATWSVEDGAKLDLDAQPTIICEGAAYNAQLEIQLVGNAQATVSEIIACAANATARIAMKITRNANIAVIDVLNLDAKAHATNPAVIGTLLILGPADQNALDELAQDCADVRIGIGAFQQGDIIARITGMQVEPVRVAIERLRAAATAPVVKHDHAGAWGATRPLSGHSEPAEARRAESAVQT